MALSRIKIKDVIKISDEKNIRDFDYDFFGININKEFMPSVANTSKVDRRKYKILRKKRLRRINKSVAKGRKPPVF